MSSYKLADCERDSQFEDAIRPVAFCRPEYSHSILSTTLGSVEDRKTVYSIYDFAELFGASERMGFVVYGDSRSGIFRHSPFTTFDNLQCKLVLSHRTELRTVSPGSPHPVSQSLHHVQLSGCQTGSAAPRVSR